MLRKSNRIVVKVERSYPAPEALAIEKAKSSGRYDKPDTVERLKQDFNVTAQKVSRIYRRGD